MDKHETQDYERATRTRILRMMRRAWPYRRYVVQILTGRLRIRCRLLVRNYGGVWSVPEGKYIKRTRSHRHRVLTNKARALREAYMYLLDELAMAAWPEFTQRDMDEVWALILKIADADWTTMPRSHKEYVARYHREQRRLIRPAAPVAKVVAASSSFFFSVVVGGLMCVSLLMFVMLHLFFF